jgi:retinol-binding protein 3
MRSIILVAKVVVVFILALFILRFVASAQQPPQPDMTIDTATRSVVIEGLIKELNDSYVFAEVAKTMENTLKTKVAAKEYDSITSARAFAEKLTADLQSVSRDKHLRVGFSAQPIPVRTSSRQPTAEEIQQQKKMMARGNYGFDRAERLDGNIGYIELRGFTDHEAGAATVAAAMTFLANTDALIFDLRQNGGGSPFMVALISSYLFGDKPVHLNDLYWRKGDKTDSFWTKPESASVKFPDKEIYILTSSRTFSAAEEFTYNLKNLKRATIIGETTGGGAHPGGMARLHDHFGAFIPTGRAINPISKTNWEGTGVEPDIKVPAAQALNTAYLIAAKRSYGREKNENLKRQLKDVIDGLEKKISDSGKTAGK